jgi:beta-galactosidase
VKLRPQVPVWEREVPAGEGITGLWRPAPASAPAGAGGGGFGGGAGQVFTFRQSGNSLTGTVEGGAAPIAIENGKVDGVSISFNAANAVYAGTLKGDQIELQRSGGAPGGRGGRGAPAEPAGPRPAVGPPPDGSDPSSAAFVGLGRGGAGGRGPQPPAPIVLQRAKR